MKRRESANVNRVGDGWEIDQEDKLVGNNLTESGIVLEMQVWPAAGAVGIEAPEAPVNQAWRMVASPAMESGEGGTGKETDEIDEHAIHLFCVVRTPPLYDVRTPLLSDAHSRHLEPNFCEARTCQSLCGLEEVDCGRNHNPDSF